MVIAKHRGGDASDVRSSSSKAEVKGQLMPSRYKKPGPNSLTYSSEKCRIANAVMYRDQH